MGQNPVSGTETRGAIRWLLGLLLLAVTAVTGALGVTLVGLYRSSERSFTHTALQVLAWFYLAAGVSLALWLLLERRGARYLFGAWLAALTLLLTILSGLLGAFGLVGGVLCALLVWGLVAAMDWATGEHTA